MTWNLLPPGPNVCQECAVDHESYMPHDKQSLYYQYHFHFAHNRWPTWDDAMAHCDEQVKEITRSVLRQNGIQA